MEDLKIEFSVLMSVYFKEKAAYLKQALQSLINQRLIPTEIVLVKDGTLTTELEEVITEFDQNYPGLLKIIAISENRGLGNALAIGLNACQYDFVARMDSDDISDFNRFERQLVFLKENPRIDVLGCALKEFEADLGDSALIKICPEFHSDINKRIRLRSPMNHPTIVFNKQRVIEAGGYNSETMFFEDYALFVRLWKAGLKLHNIPDILYHMRVDTDLNLIRRRSGIQYLKHEINFLKYTGKIKAFTILERLHYAILRFPVRLLPANLVFLIYKYLLRKKG